MAVKTKAKGLSRETLALLDHIRRAGPANRAYGLAAEVAKSQAHAAVDRFVEASGMAHVRVCELRWFIEDVAKSLCSGQGEMLAYELEGVLGKWLGLNLEPRTVQLLLRILLREVAGIEPPVSAMNDGPAPRTSRRRELRKDKVPKRGGKVSAEAASPMSGEEASDEGEADVG